MSEKLDDPVRARREATGKEVASTATRLLREEPIGRGGGGGPRH